MIAKATLIVIHSGGRLSVTMVSCGNLIIIVWTSLRLSVVLRVSLSTPCSNALISPHRKVCFQNYFNFGLNSFWEKDSGFEESMHYKKLTNAQRSLFHPLVESNHKSCKRLCWFPSATWSNGYLYVSLSHQSSNCFGLCCRLIRHGKIRTLKISLIQIFLAVQSNSASLDELWVHFFLWSDHVGIKNQPFALDDSHHQSLHHSFKFQTMIQNIKFRRNQWQRS